MVKQVEVDIVGVSPYSQSRMHDTPKLPKETWDEFELRTWREKANYDVNGELFVPEMAFKQALDAVAKTLGIQIPGKGKSTYTKHFLSGVLCDTPLMLGVKKDEVEVVKINANADGIRGSGKRVVRYFPVVPKWTGTTRFVVLNDIITKEVFERHMIEAGQFIGVGRFRPEKGGLNGRFKVAAFRWSEI